MSTPPGPDLTAALLSPISRARVVAEVELVLGVTPQKARAIVSAFDKFVAKPLEKALKDMHGRDLAYRNPMSGRKSDIRALRAGASILHAQRQHVELSIAVLHGRKSTGPHPTESGIEMVGSDDFWHRMSGVPDFRSRLMRATTVLAELIAERSADEVERIRAEAEAIYDDGGGRLKIDALVNPPRKTKTVRPEQLTLAV